MADGILHVHEKTFWRDPLALKLCRELMKKPSQPISYDCEKGVWTLNGRKVSFGKKKVLSKFAAKCIHFFHNLKCCLSKSYRKKFKLVLLNLEAVQKKSLYEASLKEQELLERQNQLLESAKKVEKTIQQSSALKQKAQEKKVRAESEFQIKTQTVDEQIASYTTYKSLLDQLAIAKRDSDTKKQSNLISSLEKEQPRSKIDFTSLEGDELNKMIARQGEKLSELAKEKETQKQEFEKGQAILQAEQQSYAAQEAEAEKTITEIRQSPLFNTPIKKPQSPALGTTASPIATPPTPPPSFGQATLRFLTLIQSHLGERSYLLWQALFKKIMERTGIDHLLSIKQTQPGLYELKFREPLRIWLHAKDEKGHDDPQGGVVFKLGSNLYNNRPNDFTLKVSVNDKDTLNFHDGLEIYCRAPRWAKKMTLNKIPDKVTTNVLEFKVRKNDKFSQKAKWSIFPKERTKTFEQLLESWSTKAKVLLANDDPDQFIEDRLAQEALEKRK